jgi:DNA-binding MarR family transcriptional regulator
MRTFPFGELDHYDTEKLALLVSPEQRKNMRTLFLLARSAANLLDYVQSVADKHGLLPARVRVLTALGFQIDEHDATPAMLAEKLKLSRSNITGLLDGLEKEGLIERLHDKEDRRSIKLRLTEEGDLRLRALIPGLADLATRLVNAEYPENCDLEDIAAMIDRILDRARSSEA